MRLALGTAQFGLNYGVANVGGQLPVTEVRSVLAFARANGIDIIDTAIAYGTSERALGEVGVTGFRVVSKLPSLPVSLGDIPSWVRYQVDASLKRLGLSQLDGLLLHRPQDLFCSNSVSLVKTLMELRAEGLVNKIGVSVYGPDEIGPIVEKLKIDLVQLPINVADRRFEHSGCLDHLRAGGVEIHARSVFLQGLLLMERKQIPLRFSNWFALLDEWHEKLNYWKITPLAACLSYPLSLRQVDRVVVGVDCLRHLIDITQASKAIDPRLDTSFMDCTDQNLINPSNWQYL